MSYQTEILTRRRGRPPRFATAEDIWAEFSEYVAFVERNPIELPMHVVKGNKREEGKGGKVARPLTLEGFVTFAGVCQSWRDFARYQCERGAEFSAVITRVRECVRDNQISGGMAGIYNSNLTARLNGLTDRQDVTSGGKAVNIIIDNGNDNGNGNGGG